MRGCSKLEPTGLRALEQAEMPQLEEVLLDDEVESEQVPGQFKELMLVVCWSFVGRLLVLFGVPTPLPPTPTRFSDQNKQCPAGMEYQFEQIWFSSIWDMLLCLFY